MEKPWEYIDAMSVNKKELDMSDPNNSTNYNPYMINRWLSSIELLLPIINELNQHSQLMTKQTHYNFLLAVLPQQKLQIDYQSVKLNKELTGTEIKYIADYFAVGGREAELYKDMMSDDEIKKILETYKYGNNQMVEV